MAAALLTAALAGLWAFLHSGWPPVPHRLARRAVRHIVWFGGMTLLGLLALGQWRAPSQTPAVFDPARALVVALVGGGLDVAAAWPWALGGIVAGGTIIGLVERWRGRPFGLGDVEAVMPRTPRELGWGVILSLTAGVMEEGYFRLLLPLLATLATGSAVVGFGLATLLFGAAHRYQGWKGMIATAVTGALLAAVYLASGALWVAIALHVAIDLNALVARPVVSGRVRFGDTA